MAQDLVGEEKKLRELTDPHPGKGYRSGDAKWATQGGPLQGISTQRSEEGAGRGAKEIRTLEGAIGRDMMPREEKTIQRTLSKLFVQNRTSTAAAATGRARFYLKQDGDLRADIVHFIIKILVK